MDRPEDAQLRRRFFKHCEVLLLKFEEKVYTGKLMHSLSFVGSETRAIFGLIFIVAHSRGVAAFLNNTGRLSRELLSRLEPKSPQLQRLYTHLSEGKGKCPIGSFTSLFEELCSAYRVII